MRHLQSAAVASCVVVLLGASGEGKASTSALIAFASSRDIAPQGGALYPNAALFLMNGDGSDVHRSFRLRGLGIRSASWSPDRTKLVVAVGDPGDVFSDIAIVDLQGHIGWLTRSRKGVDNTEPEWSPTGDAIAFASNRGGYKAGFRIFTIHPDGSGLEQVSPQRVIGPSRYSPFDRAPTWSPDARQIAFSCWEGICVVDLATHALTHVTTGYERDPAWSPDGSTIAFDRPGSGANGDVWTVDVNSHVLKNLTNTYLVGEVAPAWSPGGTKIVYQRTAPGHQDIWSMRADGGHRTPLAAAPGFDGSPAWAR